jgi:hypothetical protein
VMAQGTRRRGGGHPAIAHRPVPERRCCASCRAAPMRHALADAAEPQGCPALRIVGATRQQPQGRDGGLPGGPVHLRDRRVRLGQEHAGQRHAVRAVARKLYRATPSRPRTRRSRAWSTSTR